MNRYGTRLNHQAPQEGEEVDHALEDTKAVARCLPVILELGLVELKVKEYPEEQANNPVPSDAAKKLGAVPETAGNGPISDEKQKDDKLPIQPEKAPEIENFAKISDEAAGLLEQNNF